MSVLFLLQQTVDDLERPRHRWVPNGPATPSDTPVPNNVPWHYLALAILVCSAFLCHGIVSVARSWEDELSLPAWFSVASHAAAIVLTTTLAGAAGYLVWHWALGALVGLVGSFSSSLILSLVRARVGSPPPPKKD